MEGERECVCVFVGILQRRNVGIRNQFCEFFDFRSDQFLTTENI